MGGYIFKFPHFFASVTAYDEDHVEAQLAPILREFDLLSKCVEDINGADVRKLENNVLETPLDEPVQGQLLAKTDTMRERWVISL